ncbi:MAG: hypothetical protein LBP72_07450, partial [Dysgonamonadaceae bacterium]|nr:hypothetical protein [Dysgonamonadaceae bacterium]
MKEIFFLCSTFNRIKLLLFVCFAALSFNAGAVNGNTFTADQLIRNLRWNQEKGRVEFEVMFYDNVDVAWDEYIKHATLYINNVKLGTLTVGKSNGGDVTSSTPFSDLCFPGADNNCVNLYFYSHSASNTEHLVTYARGSTDGCRKSTTNTNYIEIPINHGTNRWYNYNAEVYRAYAEYFWYPGEMTGDQTIEVALKDIVITQQFSGNTWTRGNASYSVTATRAPASNHSM